jgi:hypothetical protein
MFAKVSGGLGITGVEVTMDHAAVSLPLAVSSTTLKNMNTAVIYILN